MSSLTATRATRQEAIIRLLPSLRAVLARELRQRNVPAREIDDIVQETMIGVWRTAAEEPYSMARLIARRRVADRMSAKRSQELPLTDWDHSWHDTYQLAWPVTLADALQEAAGAYTSRELAVCELIDAGYSQPAVGRILGMCDRTVRNVLYGLRERVTP